MPTLVKQIANDDAAKAGVRQFWESESCGSRYLEGDDERDRFERQAQVRYTFEPYIPDFAGFTESAGKRVLEIGVGLGADFVNWCRAGAQATGVDLTAAAVESTRRRCELEGFTPDLRVADAEALPFADASFDIVYSWGVLHHSPDTAQCVREVFRVLRPGGTARIMIYARPSWVALMLWLRFGLFVGRPSRSLYSVVFDHVESPGTKSYREREAREMFTAFENVRVERRLSPGDLLMNAPSSKYSGRIYQLIWQLFPRGLVRRLGNGMGLFMLIEARKPSQA